MPVYRGQHDCGYTNEQFLKADKDSTIMKCKRCGRNVTVHQVRDKTAVFATKNDVTGVLRDEQRT
jgi:translation initiation factor 2 beta subunit (eIF-2beta)/eIF-5